VDKTEKKYGYFILSLLNGVLVSYVLWWLTMQYQVHELRQINEEFRRKWDASPPDLAVYQPNLIFIMLLLTFSFVFATLVLHKKLPKYRKHPIIFWTIIGAVASIIWNILVILLAILDALITGDKTILKTYVSITWFVYGPISFPFIIALNFLYGCIVKLSNSVYSAFRRPSSASLFL